MHRELHHLQTEPTILEYVEMLFKCRRIIANSGKTYKQFLKKFKFKNNELLEILDIFSTCSGLSGNRCAALLTVSAMITSLNGSYCPEKGFIQFPLALKNVYEKNGGQLLLNSEVEKIIIESGKASGVQLIDGTIIQADYVVSTADTKLTLEKFIEFIILQEFGSRYARKAKSAKMSPSAMVIHLGLDDKIDLNSLGFNCGINVLTTGRKSYERIFDEWENSHQLMDDDCFHFGVILPPRQSDGKQTLIIYIRPVFDRKWTALRKINIREYQKEKQRVADFYIRKTEEFMIPDLREHIKYIDVATPATYERFIGSPGGSNYDMLPIPENFGKNRLKTRTPVKNLFLPKFSHGIWPSLQAGMQVVDMISNRKIMNGNASYRKEHNLS